MNPHAVIIGAGIGGLAVGRALLDAGWSVQIHERSPGLPTTGTALGLWPGAMRALDRLGLGGRIRKAAEHHRGATILRANGGVIARLGPKLSAHLISRATLLQALHQGPVSTAVTWNAPLMDVNQLPEADLVVGADGINSVVRELVAGPMSAPRPLGTVAFRGTTAGQTHAVTETWGQGRLFGITPQEAATTNWFACVRHDQLTEHDQGQNDAELLAALYADWHSDVACVVNRIDAGRVDRRELYDIPPLSSFIHSNIVVIGDAAHAMAPNLGRGAGEALIDAVALADALRHAPTISTGLQNFDNRRRKPTQRTVRSARLLNRISTSQRFTTVRNTLLTATTLSK